MTPTPTQIAANLTKAQRTVMDEVASAGPAGLGFGKSALFMRRRLISMGLTERLPSNGGLQVAREVLTPLGLQVRAILRGEHDR